MTRTSALAGEALDETPELLVDAEDAPPAPPPAIAAHHPVWLAAAIVLVALNLRPALSSVGPVLPDLAAGIGLGTAAESLLTTVPVLCLGVFGLAAPALARRLGSERTVLAFVLVLAAGIALRAVPSIAAQFGAAVIAGAGIGIAGVLLPGIVKRDFPGHVGLMTGVYTMALCAGAAAAAGASVPLAQALGGWWWGLAAWAVPALVAGLAWLPFAVRSGKAMARTAPRVTGLWGDALAWQVTLQMGLQSSLAYIVFAWLAPMLRDRGLPPVDAGFAVSISVMTQAGSALLAPIIAGRARRQSAIGAVFLCVTLAGFLGCLLAPLSTIWLWAIVLGAGQGANFGVALVLIVLRAGDAHVAARLSSMAQSVGYTLAACGPFAAGLLKGHGGWGGVGVLFSGIAAAAIVFVVLAGRGGHVGAVVQAEPSRGDGPAG